MKTHQETHTPGQLINFQIVREGRVSEFSLSAARTSDDGDYQELRVNFHDKAGNVVADIFFTVDQRDSLPVIYLSTDGDPDVQTILVRPLSPQNQAVKEMD